MYDSGRAGLTTDYQGKRLWMQEADTVEEGGDRVKMKSHIKNNSYQILSSRLGEYDHTNLDDDDIEIIDLDVNERMGQQKGICDTMQDTFNYEVLS